MVKPLRFLRLRSPVRSERSSTPPLPGLRSEATVPLPFALSVRRHAPEVEGSGQALTALWTDRTRIVILCWLDISCKVLFL